MVRNEGQMALATSRHILISVCYYTARSARVTGSRMPDVALTRAVRTFHAVSLHHHYWSDTCTKLPQDGMIGRRLGRSLGTGEMLRLQISLRCLGRLGHNHESCPLPESFRNFKCATSQGTGWSPARMLNQILSSGRKITLVTDSTEYVQFEQRDR
nr:hypothetical protein CFP56_69447 [Quercus suber]